MFEHFFPQTVYNFVGSEEQGALQRQKNKAKSKKKKAQHYSATTSATQLYYHLPITNL